MSPTVATRTPLDDAISAVTDAIIATEGGYVFDPDDRGGETNYGITVAVARSYGHAGPMRDMPRSLAQRIYADRYIRTPWFEKVFALDPAIGYELIDTGVNMGPATAAEFLQRWLNGLNAAGRYQDVFVDGRIGPLTLGALSAYIDWRGDEGRRVLLRALNAGQASRYLAITEKDRTQRRFLFGWLRTRVVMEA